MLNIITVVKQKSSSCRLHYKKSMCCKEYLKSVTYLFNFIHQTKCIWI